MVQQSVVKGHSLQSLFSTVDNDFHQQFRRCVNSAFAMSALVQYEPFVDNTTKLFLQQTEKLYANNPDGCDFTRWLQFYAFDVIGEITYSERHGFIEKNEDIDGIVAYLTSLFNYVAPVSTIPFFAMRKYLIAYRLVKFHSSISSSSRIRYILNSGTGESWT